MAAKRKAPKGTYDLLPDGARLRRKVIETARGLAEGAGFKQIDTPIFEDTELFSRGVGEATDIVSKEMYTFHDKGGRSLTLRPEGTASICRAYIEQGMHKWPQPVKLWYEGPMFRYESPQSGRFRQHYQFGVEAFGSEDAFQDAELIVLQAELYKELGLDTRLAVSSMGDEACQPAYIEKLREYLNQRKESFTPEQLERIERSPLRAFDWQGGEARDAASEAPKLMDNLCDGCRSHLEGVCRILGAAGIEYELEPELVRGLDYYTRTVFEFSSDLLGAQSGVGGGGRYDRLVKLLSGPDVPAAGWATGIERVALALEASGVDEDLEPDVDVFCAAEAAGSPEVREKAFEIALELRRRGLIAISDTVGRSLKSQLKLADRLGVSIVLNVYSTGGGDVGWLRDMKEGSQEDDVPADQLVDAVMQRLGRES